MFGWGRPVMMTVNVAGWPGFTYRSSAGTWIEEGATEQFEPVLKKQTKKKKTTANKLKT